MSWIYAVMDKLLPFGFLKYPFMKNALIAIVLSSVVFGVIGTMAVDNKMAFFSDALGHSAMTGVALGVLLGIDNKIICLIAFGVLMALLITRVKSSGTASPDTIISVFASMALAFGLLILSANRGFAAYSNYLTGDVLTIDGWDIGLLAIAVAAVLIVWWLIYNKLMLVSINPTLAASRGISPALYENVFTVLVAVVVMLSIKWVGILLINAMLILPAAAARNIARTARQYHALAVGFALLSGVAGLVASWYAGTSAGAMIVVCSGGLFFVTYFARSLSGR